MQIYFSFNNKFMIWILLLLCWSQIHSLKRINRDIQRIFGISAENLYKVTVHLF